MEQFPIIYVDCIEFILHLLYICFCFDLLSAVFCFWMMEFMIKSDLAYKIGEFCLLAFPQLWNVLFIHWYIYPGQCFSTSGIHITSGIWGGVWMVLCDCNGDEHHTLEWSWLAGYYLYLTLWYWGLRLSPCFAFTAATGSEAKVQGSLYTGILAPKE